MSNEHGPNLPSAARETTRTAVTASTRHSRGASGYQRAEYHEQQLRRQAVAYSLRQELDGGWMLRFGPLRAVEIAAAMSAFAY